MTNIYAKYLKSKQIIFLINNKTTTITNLVYVTSNDKIILSSAMVAAGQESTLPSLAYGTVPYMDLSLGFN